MHKKRWGIQGRLKQSRERRIVHSFCVVEKKTRCLLASSVVCQFSLLRFRLACDHRLCMIFTSNLTPKAIRRLQLVVFQLQLPNDFHENPIGLKGLMGLNGLISELFRGGVRSSTMVKVVLTVPLD
jgi:hypothetical protein